MGAASWSGDESASWGKTNFDEIYSDPDPRAFYRTLGSLEYRIPGHGQRVFRRVIDLLEKNGRADDAVTMMDLCCSYGVNAALVNHELTLDDLYGRYNSRDLDGVSSQDLMASDREYYAAHRRDRPARMYGLDAAAPAIRYAAGSGLLDGSFAEDLESHDPTAELAAAAAATDVITVTGGVGYVTSRTFGRLLDAAERPPWVAAFVLRTVPYEPIRETLAEHGLVTEQYGGRTFTQRRFADEQEQEGALKVLDEADVDPTGREADGYYHTDFFLSRPPEDAAALPVDKIFDEL